MTELDKWSNVRDEFIIIQEFLQKISSDGINLAEYVGEHDHFYPITHPYRDIIMKYLGVNTNKLEKERRKLLEKMQND